MLLRIVLGGIAVVVVSVAVFLGYHLIRFPTMGQLRTAVGQNLVYSEGIAFALTHHPEARGIVGTSFPKPGKDGGLPEVPIAPIADVVVLSPKRVEQKGHGVARVTGLALAKSYSHELVPNTAIFTGTVSFDYEFLWDDNGRARVWRCNVWNLAVVDSAKP
jgi:hypothetical protein